MNKRQIVLIVVDVRSAHNVGSLLRTADAMEVESVYLVGITPHPSVVDDKRLPHVVAKAERDIQKTALGAEQTLDIKYCESTELKQNISKLTTDGYEICALEQTGTALALYSYKPADKVVLIVGNEVGGLDNSVLSLADVHLAIQMLGKKESLNVAVAGGMALYHLRFAGRE